MSAAHRTSLGPVRCSKPALKASSPTGSSASVRQPNNSALWRRKGARLVDQHLLRGSHRSCVGCAAGSGERRCAMVAASSLFGTSSLCRMCETWTLAVLVLIVRAAAISRFV